MSSNRWLVLGSLVFTLLLLLAAWLKEPADRHWTEQIRPIIYSTEKWEVRKTAYEDLFERGNLLAGLLLEYGHWNATARTTPDYMNWHKRNQSTKVIERLSKLADKGDSLAQGLLGMAYLYYLGGVGAGEETARSWLEKSAAQNEILAQYLLGDHYDQPEKGEPDKAKALWWFRLAAEQGFPPAEFYMGRYYARGQGGVERSYPDAVRWYLRAAEKNERLSQGSLGVIYETGRGVTQDYQKAAHWYAAAAEQGEKTSMYNLGKLYEKGKGVERDFNRAAELFISSAERGYAKAALALARMYEQGSGREIDQTEAFKWHRKAAELGDPSAMNMLGQAYRDGRMVEQNYDTAIKWFKKGAQKKSNRAAFNLGRMYEKGLGRKPDYLSAARYYQQAAGSGRPGQQRGHRQLGRLYEKGLGVPRDYNQALKWYKEAAGRGDHEGQAYLGRLYEYGLGVKRDYAQAAEWYEKAALGEVAWAQYRLARLYAGNFPGLKADPEQALIWHRIAAANGYHKSFLALGNFYETGRNGKKDFNEALYWYGRAWLRDGSDPAAISGLKRSLEALIFEARTGSPGEVKKKFKGPEIRDTTDPLGPKYLPPKFKPRMKYSAPKLQPPTDSERSLLRVER